METVAKQGFETIVNEALSRLTSVRFDDTGSFITTPLMYPSGGSVVIWVRRAKPNFLVSDFGYAYRECSIMGADKRQFQTRASAVAEASGVSLAGDSFEVLVSEGQLEGAIKTIANCSQEAALRFAHRIFQRRREDVGTIVHKKLTRLYGEKHVARDFDFTGASQSHWHIDVAVKQEDKFALFDTVTPWAQSVAFTLAKFGDIRLLDQPPPRTAVLSQERGYGNWMTALAQNGTIIQASAGDNVYRHAAGLR